MNVYKISVSMSTNATFIFKLWTKEDFDFAVFFFPLGSAMLYKLTLKSLSSSD